MSAFDAFLKDHWLLLVRFVASYVQSVDEAEDLAQEAFVRLWVHRRCLRPSGSVRAYLYQIARNLAINECKGQEVRQALDIHVEEPSSPPAPDRGLELAKLRAVVEQAIESLPPRRREAFILAHLQNLTHGEIAEVMGISPQTVANQISAALATLRQTLGPYVTGNHEAMIRRMQ